MVRGIDVCGHDVVVCAVEEDFAEEFDGLPFCDVVVGGEEGVVLREELSIAI